LESLAEASRVHVTAKPKVTEYIYPIPRSFFEEMSFSDIRVETRPSTSTATSFNYDINEPWLILCECGGLDAHIHPDTMNGAGETTSGNNVATSTPSTVATPRQNRPMPNFVQVAKSYLFEQEIQQCLKETGVTQAREDSIRLAGVQWIENVRRALKL
jgi:hypothetical protein